MEPRLTPEIGERETLALFKGWFHNKMMVILVMSQYPKLRPKSCGVQNQLTFLGDLEHHFLRQGTERKPFRHAIRWLSAFFRIYPRRVSPARRTKVLRMVRVIYDAFGFPMYWDGKEPSIPFHGTLGA